MSEFDPKRLIRVRSAIRQAPNYRSIRYLRIFLDRLAASQRQADLRAAPVLPFGFDAAIVLFHDLIDHRQAKTHPDTQLFNHRLTSVIQNVNDGAAGGFRFCMASTRIVGPRVPEGSRNSWRFSSEILPTSLRKRAGGRHTTNPALHRHQRPWHAIYRAVMTISNSSL